MSEKLEFDLTVKNNQLDPALDSASKKSGNLQSALNTALGVFGGGVALKGFDLLSNSIGNVISFAEESVQKAAEQEESYNRLGQALRAAGDASKDSLDDMIRFTGELESNSKQSSEAIAQQLAYGKALGLSNQQTKDLVQAATELSATFGGSLESNVALLGNTFNGTAGKLGKLIPELKNLTTEQLVAGDAAKIINDRFGGNAQAELDSYAGRLHVLSSAYEDLQKQIGGIIVGSKDLGEGEGVLTAMLKELTQVISDWRIESARQNGTLTETESSIDQLKRKYEELQVELIDLEQVANNPSVWQYVTGQVAFARGELDNFKAAVDAAKEAYNSADFEKKKGGYIDDGSSEAATPQGRQLPEDVLNARKKMNDEILLLDQQLVAEQNNIQLEQDNAAITDDLARQQAEIQRIQDFEATKIELQAQLKDAEIQRTLDGEEQRLALLKNSGEKELALAKVKNDSLSKQANLLRDAEKKAATERIAQQQATSSTISGIIGAGANLSVLLTKEGSKEQFFIQKAAALAQALVATNLAIAMANAVPPPGNIPAMAAAKANGAIAISGILASTIQGFAEGGVIGGEGQGASNGPDNTTFKGRNGEMVLTAEDQSMLLSSIRNGGMGGGDIVIQIGEEVVFRAVRNQMKKGYKLP
jgi:hypothetical protein